MSERAWNWHWNPRKWQLVGYTALSGKFLYVQVGPLVMMEWRNGR